MSLSGEFAARTAKLQREQRERIQQKQKRRAAEHESARQQQERLTALEEEGRQRRLAELARQDELRLQREAEAARTRGVTFEAQLRAVPLDDTADVRGIKRAADKVLLPPSVGTSLLHQDAAVNGPPYFEIRTPLGAATHAGVLDYSAAEGCIALPAKVIRSLWGPDVETDACNGVVHVKYTRLEKGTFVRFQPRQAAFQKELGDAVSNVLEACLHTHSALSEGDWLAVQHGGQHYDLRVLDLRPAPHVSVIDTEMEAEVEVSEETVARKAAEGEAAARRAEQLVAIRAEQQREAAEAAAETERRAAEAAQQAAQVNALRKAKEAALPEEPPASVVAQVVTCVLRFPDGSRVSRRFRTSDLLQTLFDFTDAKGSASRLEPGTYKLVAQMPRRVLHPSACGHDVTLQRAGLQTGQEMIMLEPLD